MRGQLPPDLGDGGGGLLGEDDGPALDHCEGVQQRALGMLDRGFVMMVVTLIVILIVTLITCLRWLLMSAGVIPTMPNPIQ